MPHAGASCSYDIVTTWEPMLEFLTFAERRCRTQAVRNKRIVAGEDQVQKSSATSRYLRVSVAHEAFAAGSYLLSLTSLRHLLASVLHTGISLIVSGK